MREFTVWAPYADRMTLRIAVPGTGEATDLTMTRDGTGWWRAEVEQPGADGAGGAGGAGGADLDYGFLIDDDPAPRPDPRSRRQPRGVHGTSRTFDAGTFAWTDAGWTGRQLVGGTIYELHIGTFTESGTFDSAISRLDHLVDLGIDFVEVLPVNAFNGTHNWGYDGVLWYAVQESYGGPAGYQRFVDACHARGLGVIQDVVHNHLGPSGNYLPLFGPYLHSGQANTWGSSVNLDGPGSDEVRRYIGDNIRMWFAEYHVDGLRLDAVHALSDHRAVHILEQLAAETDALSAQLGRPLSLIAESDLGDPRLITARPAGGYGLTAQWNDDYHHALHVALTGETTGYYADFGADPGPLSAIAKVLTGGYFHDGSYSEFRGRHHGRPLDTNLVPATALLGYSQNHDQIGNRAAGDRLTATLRPGQLAVAAVMVLAGPFTPMLFMGEEWAASTPWQFFTSHPEPEVAAATARGRLIEFERMGWDPDTVPDPQDPTTFARSKLEWAETELGHHAEIHALYRELLRLRRTWPQLTDPRFDRIAVEFDEQARWLVMDRGGLQVAVNFAAAHRSVTLRPHGQVLLSTDPTTSIGPDTGRLASHSAVLLAPPG